MSAPIHFQAPGVLTTKLARRRFTYRSRSVYENHLCPDKCRHTVGRHGVRPIGRYYQAACEGNSRPEQRPARRDPPQHASPAGQPICGNRFPNPGAAERRQGAGRPHGHPTQFPGYSPTKAAACQRLAGHRPRCEQTFIRDHRCAGRGVVIRSRAEAFVR